jgi:hypothetical protein
LVPPIFPLLHLLLVILNYRGELLTTVIPQRLLGLKGSLNEYAPDRSLWRRDMASGDHPVLIEKTIARTIDGLSSTASKVHDAIVDAILS